MTTRTRSAGPIVALALAAAPLAARAFPTYYDGNCAPCHGTTAAGGVQTCAGCHSHGTHPDSGKSSLNVTGVTNKTTYAPGETVSVTINGGYRSGWVRTILYDQNLHELARSTGTVLPGFSAPSRGPSLPVTLTAPAPTTPGTYTWWAAWYGNQYDASGAFFGPGWTPSTTNPGHGEERVQTNSFTVVAPANPTIALTPPSLAFGSVTVGSSAPLTTSVQNTGTGPLTVSSIALCSGTNAEFTWSPAAPFTVAPGQATTLTVTFTPTNADTDVGCLAIGSNDPANPSVDLALSATGVVPAVAAIALSPSSLAFGTVTIGSSATLTAQVQDTGTAPLDVTGVAACAGTSGAFTWSPAPPFVVAAGGSTTLSVTYTPTTTTGDSGCLAITSSDPARPTVDLNVGGNGAAPSVPAIAFAPSTLAFGTVTVGTTAQQTAQIRNTGTAPLSVTAIAPCSGTSGEFTWSPAAPFSVSAGQSMALTVTYAPIDVDVENGCLAVSSDDPSSPVANLGLTAQGAAVPTPAVALVPSSLDFMTVQIGATATLTTQIQNGGGAPLDVTAIAACSGTSPEFGWSPAAPITVAPGQAATLSVTYAPIDAGPDNGCLALSTDDPNHATIDLGLAGVGQAVTTAPAIALVPPALDFGAVNVGGQAMRTAQVQNTGTAALDVSSITACSGTSAEFTWTPSGPFTVSPGQEATLTVTYAPTDVGADTGCLLVASDDPSTPSAQLQLAGSGAQATAGADVDVARLLVPYRVDPRRISSITPRILARNEGTANGSAPATLVGVLNGTQVYAQTIQVSLAADAFGAFDFPPYAVAPSTTGTLVWTVAITDDDADLDQARARTVFRAGEREDDSGEGEQERAGGGAAPGVEAVAAGSGG
ncbi:MAG TPA: choice-of-anchor D domain-containing protein, partial [Anaeromyxobacter sp.]|nr:choice-of-anchor D domain-containing protein [Anaeromyxobacter sp.]